LEEISLELYYDQSAAYKEDINKIRESCYDFERDRKVSFRQAERHSLSAGRIQTIEDEIRGLIPQERGSIVTSHGFLLPLSNSKKLNLGNTPVLLVKFKGKLVYVFPCLLGDSYYNLTRGINHLKTNLPNLPSLAGFTEDMLVEQILNKLEMFEQGLTLIGRELETSAGKADLVLLDKQRRHVIVEVEREASDSSLGQILRLCSAYERKFGLPTEKIRAVVACDRIHEFVREAASRAGIEIWVIPKKRESENHR
jgi:hypothetical protein